VKSFSDAELGRFGIFGRTCWSNRICKAFYVLLWMAMWPSDEPILVLNTGSGLKDIKAAIRRLFEAPIIEPTLDALKKDPMKSRSWSPAADILPSPWFSYL